jgi:LAS superfamily LD-carboxypeptidase LdcB
MKKTLFSISIIAIVLLVGYRMFYGDPVTTPAVSDSKDLVEDPNMKGELTDDNPKVNKKDSTKVDLEPFFGEIKFLTGNIDYSAHPEYFVKVAAEYCSQAMYMHKDAYEAFKKMHAAAKKDGISLTILSGARNFESQKRIWEGKWTSRKATDDLAKAKNILEYSSMPMSSRHHWGTDIDLNSLNNDYFKTGKGKKEYDWLVKNAPSFKFCQVYTENDNDKLCDSEVAGDKRKREGYRLEKWHWSYMPVSSKLFENYNKLVENESIKGFKGSELAGKLKIKEHFVGGISDTCKCVE